MATMTVLLALVLGAALGAGATRARLWWRMYQVRTGEAALQRRRVEFEARRVQWERRACRLEPAGA